MRGLADREVVEAASGLLVRSIVYNMRCIVYGESRDVL